MSERKIFTQYFREVQLNFSRLYTTVLTQAELTLPQYALLNQLAALGPVSMTLVSKKLHISKPAVTNLVDRLEQNRCLKRLAHPKDRRIYLLQIQPKGKKIVRKIQAHVLAILLQTLAQFSAKDKKTITQFYKLLSQQMERVSIDVT